MQKNHTVRKKTEKRTQKFKNWPIHIWHFLCTTAKLKASVGFGQFTLETYLQLAATTAAVPLAAPTDASLKPISDVNVATAHVIHSY